MGFQTPSEEVAPHASGAAVESHEGKRPAAIAALGTESQDAGKSSSEDSASPAATALPWKQRLRPADRAILALHARHRSDQKREDDGRCEWHNDGRRCLRPGSTLISDEDGIPLLVCSRRLSGAALHLYMRVP